MRTPVAPSPSAAIGTARQSASAELARRDFLRRYLAPEQQDGEEQRRAADRDEQLARGHAKLRAPARALRVQRQTKKSVSRTVSAHPAT